MAIERLQIKNMFRAQALDTSRVRTMQALAGVGQSLSNLGSMAGENIASSNANNTARDLMEEANLGEVEITNEDGSKDTVTKYDNIPQQFGWGARAVDSAIKAGYRATAKNNSTKITSVSREEYPNDPEGYIRDVEASMKGMSSQMPIELSEQFETYTKASMEVDLRAIRGVARREALVESEAEVEQMIKHTNVLASTLAFDGNVFDLDKIVADFAEEGQKLVDENLMSPTQFENEKFTLIEQITEQSVLGSVDQIISAEMVTDKDGTQRRITHRERITAAENALEVFKDSKGTPVADPFNPKGPPVYLSLEQHDRVTTQIRAQISEANRIDRRDTLLAKIDVVTQQNNNMQSWDNDTLYNQDSNNGGYSPDELAHQLNELVRTGNITETQSNIRKKLITSKKAITTIDDTDSANKIVNSVYAMLGETDPLEYQKKYMQIFNEMARLQDVGKLTKDKVQSLEGSITYLTAPSNAKSIKRLSRRLFSNDTRNAIDREIPSYLRSQVQQQIFTEAWPLVEAAQVKAEADGDTFGDNEREKIYSMEANRIIDETQKTEAYKGAEILSGRMKAVPTVESGFELRNMNGRDRYVRPVYDSNGKLIDIEYWDGR